MRGRVVNGITGEPVRNAVITLGFAPVVFGGEGVIPDPTAYPRPPPFLSATSGLEGSYRIEGIPQGTFRVEISHPDFFTRVEGILFPVRHTENRDLGITPVDYTGDLSGTVIDGATQLPIEGVEIFQLDRQLLIFGLATRSAADGTFMLEGLAAGPNRVVLRAPGFRDLEALIDVAPRIAVSRSFFLVRDSGRITGLITSSRNNQPLPNVAVRVISGTATAISGADGRYVLDPVLEGLVPLEFLAPNHDRLVVTASVSNSKVTTVDVLMRFNRATIQGRVTDVNGGGIAGATVSMPAQVLTTLTAVDGSYSFVERVRVENTPQLVAIGASATGFLPAATSFTALPGQTIIQDFVLLSTFGNFTGIVEDGTTLQPLLGVEVDIPVLDESHVTDAAGAFLFAGLPQGTYQVDVRALGYSPITTFVIVPGGTTTAVRIRVTP